MTTPNAQNQRLVAFIDTSAYAESVCDYAAWLAPRTGFEIELVHALNEKSKPPTNMSGSIGLGARTNLLQELAALDAQRAKLAQTQGRAVLTDARARMVSAAPDGKSLAIHESLRTDGVIEAVQALNPRAGLMLVGKRGEYRDADSGLIGTNVEAVIRASTAPVLVANRAFSAPTRFMIAYDGGPSTARAVDHIATHDGLKGLDGLVVSVGKRRDDALMGKMQAAAERLSANGKPSRALWLDHENVEDGIVEAASEHRIDLLVIGAYGHSRIRTMVVGSTTTEMVQRCRVPVLMFR